MEKKSIYEFLCNNMNILLCPICSERFQLNGNSLECSKKHCFDIAKNGYINLLLSQSNTQYNREMFESRKYVNTRGFFKPMTDEIKKHIGDTKYKFILDLGCGEGSHISEISSGESINIGIDICKDAIKFAQGSNIKKDNTIFCVADISKLPIKEKTVDIVTNILSPYNTEELKRILKPSGTIIKIIPGTNYLAELRKEFFKNTKKETYSNEQIANNFHKNFDVKKEIKINYEVPTDSEYINHIINMTPLSFNFMQGKSLNLPERKFDNISSITVDIMILVA